MNNDDTQALQAQVNRAREQGTQLQIQGGGTKSFYGQTIQAEVLSTQQHRGIINYEPTELVLTARGGTPLSEIEAALAVHNQVLPFEPPHFGAAATLGGTIACGMSGPRRPYIGAARDFVLGCRVLTGKGDVLHFGGEVMKNVAGYDVARLMTGAMGTLGVLLDISLKILPRPASEITLQLNKSPAEALQAMNHWAGQPVPLSAAVHEGESLMLRLSGATSAVAHAQQVIDGEPVPDSETYWDSIREHTHSFFADERPLWRLSLAPGQSPLALAGDTLLDWGGAQRWLLSNEAPETVRKSLEEHGGHATLFRRNNLTADSFQSLPKGLKQIHQRLKQTFDPEGILNPGRMYPDI